MTISADTSREACISISNKLRNREVTLFLGAGINYGLVNADDVAFPLGNDLSQIICSELLSATKRDQPLAEVADMARYRVGESAFNTFIYDLFTSFRPGHVHHGIAELPWDTIYTTNFDLLLEKAFEEVVGENILKPVLSQHTSLQDFTDAHVLYYKLHGSIDFANTTDGRLTLTKQDYRYYDTARKPLFARLKRDLLSRAIVFVGYSLQDSNFSAILEDCREQLGVATLPLSYAIRPGVEDFEAAYWAEKYNVRLIDTTGEAFFELLRKTWQATNLLNEPTASALNTYVEFDQSTRFQRVAGSFYKVNPEACTGPSNPKAFFRGGEITWGDVRDKIAPPRDEYWTVFEALFSELYNPIQSLTAYLVTGAAGTGKTTLVRTLAYDLAKSFDQPILIHIPGTPLDVNAIGSLYDETNPRRIIVIIHHAAETLKQMERFAEETRRRKLPVTLLLEERKNQWLYASQSLKSRIQVGVFELGQLSDGEIGNILEALAAHDSLGRLTGSDQDQLEQHFAELAGKDLLVALRELTSEDSFDKIIRDEYASIPSDVAKQVYLYVSSLGQFGFPVRYETLIRILNLIPQNLNEQVFVPTEGVLISGEAIGNSRHNSGFRLHARHPIIASIIFGTVAGNDEAKFNIINDILNNLDPGYLDDRRLLSDLVRRRDLVNTLADPSKRRSVYDRLQSLLPYDAYVLQHRSLLERDLGDHVAAEQYARAALAREPNNVSFRNTLGFALELVARHTSDDLKRSRYHKEANSLFDEGILANPASAYDYLGKASLLRQQIDRANGPEKIALESSLYLLLQEGFDATNESPILAKDLAAQRERLGNIDQAEDILRSAVQLKPADERTRLAYISCMQQQNRLVECLRLTLDGIALNPTSWRLQKLAAQLKMKSGAPINVVTGFYEGAIRHRQGDLNLLVELGAYLFTNKQYEAAAQVFQKATALKPSDTELHRERQKWVDTSGNLVSFTGRVDNLMGAYGFVVAIPENFRAAFSRTQAAGSDLNPGDQVQFTIRFNARGPLARILNKRR